MRFYQNNIHTKHKKENSCVKYSVRQLTSSKSHMFLESNGI